MPSITVAIPEELNEVVKRHNDINWPEVARRAVWLEAQKLELMDKLAGKSKLTERDIEEIDHLIKRDIVKRYS